MKLPHLWSKATPLSDDDNLVSYAGLVPVMALAEQEGLSQLIAERMKVASARGASAGVNPAGKLTSISAGMAAGAACRRTPIGVAGHAGPWIQAPDHYGRNLN